MYEELIGEVGRLVSGAVLTALLLAVGHWFPWVKPLSRVHAYIYGVGAIVAGFALWQLLSGTWMTVVGLLIICGAGGGTVIVAYRVDGVVKRLRQAHMAERGDDELAIAE